MAIGKDAKLSPGARAALEKLASAVEGEPEVQGYGVCLDVHVGSCAFYFSAGLATT